jgi:hypothetical protein
MPKFCLSICGHALSHSKMLSASLYKFDDDGRNPDDAFIGGSKFHLKGEG